MKLARHNPPGQFRFARRAAIVFGKPTRIAPPNQRLKRIRPAQEMPMRMSIR
jgi:hypothetical protein